jgi:hypothetical protein
MKTPFQYVDAVKTAIVFINAAEGLDGSFESQSRLEKA